MHGGSHVLLHVTNCDMLKHSQLLLIASLKNTPILYNLQLQHKDGLDHLFST